MICTCKIYADCSQSLFFYFVGPEARSVILPRIKAWLAGPSLAPLGPLAFLKGAYICPSPNVGHLHQSSQSFKGDTSAALQCREQHSWMQPHWVQCMCTSQVLPIIPSLVVIHCW